MTKNEVLKIILEYLKQYPTTTVQDIIDHFEAIREQQLVPTVVVSPHQKVIPVSEAVLSGADRLLVNEVLWDLVFERVITPGTDKKPEWPWLTVTSVTKLHIKLLAQS